MTAGKNWEESFRNADALSGETIGRWQAILDGLTESFGRYLGVRLDHATKPELYVDRHDMTLTFPLIGHVPTALGRLNFYVTGSVTKNAEHYGSSLYACMPVFLFLDKVALKADHPKPDDEGNTFYDAHQSDYLAHTFEEDESGVFGWRCHGWQSGFYDEYASMEFDHTPTDDTTLKVVLPDDPDERYHGDDDPIDVFECPMCDRGYIVPRRVMRSYRLAWVCDHCASLWESREPFEKENAVPAEQYVAAISEEYQNRDVQHWLQPCPFRWVMRNVSRCRFLPPGASSIYACRTDGVSVYECFLPEEFLEDLAAEKCWELRRISRETRIPRYVFYQFELWNNAPGLDADQPHWTPNPKYRPENGPLYHTAHSGFVHSTESENFYETAVYDTANQTLYYYRFDHRPDSFAKETASHGVLMKICNHNGFGS